MMNFQIDHWTPVKGMPTLGAIRLRHAAGYSMLGFFLTALAGLIFPFKIILPLMMVFLLCWVIIGSASRKTRTVSHRLENRYR